MVTYTKLKDGSWGLRGPVSELQAGRVTVSKKDGTSKVEVVDSILVTFEDGNGLAKIGRSETSSSRPSNSHGHGHGKRTRCRECGGALKDAPHHRAMGGYCGSCAFDEFDM
jgi:hypothetical protein